MATTIDQKVVEMRFDNRDFEKNTKQTMSTLEKLKAKLNFKGASDGLEEVGKAARRVNMNGLADGIQTVSAKFSAMEIIGTTALVNLTNTAVNAGKQMVKSLTVDQVTKGWSKMDQKISSVQTLVNSTGKSVEEIDEYLSQLMWYSDETSYGFTDMTAALANMTATGGNIDKLVPMIRGMANATAYAGKGAAEFSRVIYNLNQSYGAGHLQLMDWKSVQLAGVNSKQLTEELIKAGEELGTIKKGQVTIGNFNESLKDKWATTQVMELAFGKFDKLSQAAYEAVKRGEFDTASEAIQALSKNYDELAVKAFRSAQEAKSFKEAMDATADASSTAWMEIFSSVLGNYNDQKRIFTDLANWLYDVFVTPIYNIQEVVDGAFNFKAIQNIFDKIKNNPVAKSFEEINNKVKATSHTLEEYQKMVDRIWRGDFKNQPYRKALVEEQGYNYAATQSLVNLGADRNGYYTYYRITMEDVIAAETKYGVVATETVETAKEETKAVDELTDERLKSLGLTEDEIAMYRMLEKGAKKYGLSIDELIEKMTKRDARSLLFGKKALDENGEIKTDEDGNTIWEIRGVAQNISSFVSAIFKQIGKAWHDTFGEIISVDLYMFIDRLHQFSEALRKITEDENSQGMKNLKDTFQGLFSILKLITTVLGGGFKIAWTIFKTVLETLGYDVLDVTGAIGRVVSSFTKFITENAYVTKGIVLLTKAIANAIINVHDFAKRFISLNKIVEKTGNIIQKVGDWFKNLGKEGLKEFVKDLQKFMEGLKTTDNIPKYIFESFIKGCKKYGGKLWDGIRSVFDTLINKASDKFKIEKGEGFFSFGVNCVKGLVAGLKYGAKNGIQAFAEWASNILKAFAEKLGIHSPSTEFFAFGGNIVQGLYNGIASMIGLVYNLITSIGGKLIEIVKNMDLGSVFVSLVSAGAIFGLVKLAQAMNILAEGLQGINNLIYEAAGVLKAFKGVLKVFEVKLITSALKDIAIAVAILTGSIWLLTTLDTGKVWASIGAIAALVVLLGGLVAVAGTFGKKDALQFGKLALTILAIGVAMMLMASALKKIAKIKDISWQALIVFGAMIGTLIAISAIAGRANGSLIKFGTSLISIGVALLLMARVVKSLGKLDPKILKQGIITLIIFEAMIVGLMAATKLLTGSSNVAKIGGALMSIGVTLILMSRVVKTLGKMNPDQLKQGLLALTAFEAMIVGLMAATRLLTGSKNISAIGKTLIAVGGAILMMGITAKMLGSMDVGNLVKGSIAVGVFMSMILGLIYGIKKIGGKDINNINKTLFGVAACIAIMSLSAALLGMMSVGNLAKGIIAVGLLTTFVIGLVKSTEKARNLGKSLIPLVVAIGVLALSVGLLSLIDPKRLAAPTAALGILMTLFGVMIKMSKDIGGQKGQLKNLIVMTAAVAVIAGVIALLSALSPESVLSTAVAIGSVLLAMSVSLMVLSKINTKDMITGIIGLLAVTVALFPLIGAIALMSKVKNAIPAINALILFMGALTLMLIGIAATGAIYAATGELGLLGLVGLYAMIPFLFSIIGVLAIMNAVPNAEANVLLLTSLLTAMIGMLIPLSILGPLAMIGVVALQSLVLMMVPLMLFATAIGALMKMMPMLEEFMDNGMDIMIAFAGKMGEMIGAFVSGALTQLSEGLPQIGMNLSKFMLNATPFFVGCEMINGQTLKAAGILTATILALTAADLINGIASFLSGGDNFSTLGTELSKFAVNALPFLTIMAAIPSAAMNGVKSLANAILTLTAANILDGLTKFFGGGSASLSQFGAQLPALGTQLGQFVVNLGTFTEEQVSAADCAGKAIEALANSANKLPKSDGLWQAIFGEASLSKFAGDMPGVATGVKEFVSNLGEFSDPQIKTAECACKVIEALANAADSIPKSDGLWQKIFGSKGLKDFAKDMPSVAEGVAGFIDKLDGYEDKANVAAASGDIIKGIAKLNDVDFEKFPTDKIKSTLPAVGEGIASFIGKLKGLAEDDVKSSNNKLELITNAVKTLVDTISNGFTDNTGQVITSVDTLAKKASSALGSDSIVSQVKTQGKNFVQGFANGISENSSISEDAARNIAAKALEASRKRLDERSPSKETQQQGEYFGEGFVMGIEKYSTKIYNVSENIGTQAKNGLSAAIAKISSLVDSGIETNPTIRPVLDLSNINDGARAINSMFANPSMQVAANLSSISTGMNNRNQNGTANDVVSAINKLGSNLGSGGDTYNINGITYDDQSSVSEAIQVLIRAANIERRS